MEAIEIVPDSERRGLIGALPRSWRPFASLMRIDRPIGTWLLYWPCVWSLALPGVGGRWDLFAWLLLGAFAMRSAGCVRWRAAASASGRPGSLSPFYARLALSSCGSCRAPPK